MCQYEWTKEEEDHKGNSSSSDKSTGIIKYKPYIVKHNSINDLTIQVSQEGCEILWESVPYVKLYRYNPKHLYPKLNGYGDNSKRKVWTS